MIISSGWLNRQLWRLQPIMKMDLGWALCVSTTTSRSPEYWQGWWQDVGRLHAGSRRSLLSMVVWGELWQACQQGRCLLSFLPKASAFLLFSGRLWRLIDVFLVLTVDDAERTRWCSAEMKNALKTLLRFPHRDPGHKAAHPSGVVQPGDAGVTSLRQALEGAPPERIGAAVSLLKFLTRRMRVVRSKPRRMRKRGRKRKRRSLRQTRKTTGRSSRRGKPCHKLNLPRNWHPKSRGRDQRRPSRLHHPKNRQRIQVMGQFSLGPPSRR